MKDKFCFLNPEYLAKHKLDPKIYKTLIFKVELIFESKFYLKAFYDADLIWKCVEPTDITNAEGKEHVSDFELRYALSLRSEMDG